MWVVVSLIPILYESTLSDATFQTNGICRLTDTLNCTVTEERNGEYSLELEYPFSGIHADEITVNRIIKAKANDTSDLQCFRIFSVTPTLDGKRIKVEANHISYDLCFFPVTPFNGVFNSVATSITGILNNSVNPSGFYNSADYEPASAVSFKVIFPKSIRSCLGGSEGSVLDNFGGEYEWDNRLIKWHKARGKDNGVTIRYGKNLTDYKQETNIEQTVCGILPYYNMDGVVVYGSIQYSDNYESFPFRKVATKDFTDKFADGGEAPSAAQLESLAAAYIANNGIGQPEVCIEVEFYPVGQTEGYEDFKALEQVSLCDIVTVIFPDLNVRTKAKVVKTIYNSLLEKYNKIELGTIRRTLADTIASMENTTNAVSGGGGGGGSVTVDDALSTTSENPVQNNVITAALEGKMEHWDLLWENPSITSAFAAQTLSPSFAGYDFFLLIYGLSNTSPNNRMSMFLKVGEQSSMSFASWYGSSTLAVNDRSFYFTNNKIHFNDCTRHVSGQSSSSTYNNGAIPQKIYGIKNS